MQKHERLWEASTWTRHGQCVGLGCELCRQGSAGYDQSVPALCPSLSLLSRRIIYKARSSNLLISFEIDLDLWLNPTGTPELRQNQANDLEPFEGAILGN